jgi:hypothetical protein
MITPKQVFKKLSPEGKKEVLKLERQLAENYRQQQLLNRMEKHEIHL